MQRNCQFPLDGSSEKNHLKPWRQAADHNGPDYRQNRAVVHRTNQIAPLAYVVTKKKAGDKVNITVMRGRERLTFALPIQN